MDHITQTNYEDISAIALFTELFRQATDEQINYSDSEIHESLATWKHIFRYQSTLVMALNIVKTTLMNERADELADRYLACLEGQS